MNLDTELWTAIANVGFPIVLSVLLLWRFDRKFDELSKSLTKLVTLMEIICREKLQQD